MESNLEKAQSTEVAKPIRRGLEEPTAREDLIIPRAKLLQALSPEVIEQPQVFRQGLIINSITKEILPEFFVPCVKFTNWVRFNPRKKDDPNFDPSYGPGDLMWMSTDPKDPRVIKEGSFGANGEAPAATKFLNFISYFPGHDMPVVVSFSKTSFKAGKQLMTMVQCANCDLFGRKYKLGSKFEQKDVGSYFVLTISMAGKPTDEEYAQAEAYWEQFSTVKESVKIHDQEEDGKTDDKVPF